MTDAPPVCDADDCLSSAICVFRMVPRRGEERWPGELLVLAACGSRKHQDAVTTRGRLLEIRPLIAVPQRREVE